MTDDISSPFRMPKKTRSASICATGGSIETVIYNMPSGNNTPDAQGTPNYRRRRPATRSQSARITATAGRSVRRRPQQQQPVQHNLQDTRSYCTSEPRLSETETPPQRRKLSQRKPQQQQQQHPHRRSNAFLDVPTMNMHHLRVSDDEDLDRLRTFSASKGGIINRGDSFRRRRSRSNSLAPVSPIHPRVGALAGYTDVDVNSNDDSRQQVEVYHVEMLGASGVGKQALVSQFRTSDCINAYDGPECDEAEQNISIILNGIESELKFIINARELKLWIQKSQIDQYLYAQIEKITYSCVILSRVANAYCRNCKRSDKLLGAKVIITEKDELEKADAFLVVYSCVDKESFTRAKQILSRLQDMDLIRTRPIILVANKIDLARSRAVSAQDGKCLACTFGAKFIEVSVGINHNCDELLAGTLTQIRLKKEQNLLQPKTKKLKNKSKDKDKPKDNSNSDNNCHNKNCDFDQGEKSLNDKNCEVMGHRDTSPSPAHWYKSRSVMMASMKARQMLTWILGKEDSKFKHCENLQVL